jgi:hypothetical protein
VKYECIHGCSVDIGMSMPAPTICEEHGSRYIYAKALGSNGRRSLRSVSEKNQEKVRQQRSTLKEGRGFAVAPVQRAKVRDLPCVLCGLDRHEAQIDPAHLYPRSRAACEHPEGVIPLCREHHDAYDDPNRSLDLLPALLAHGYRVELAHAFLEHGAGWIELLDLVTGESYEPRTQVPA